MGEDAPLTNRKESDDLMSNKPKRRRKMRAIPVIIAVLVVILLVLLVILFSRLGGLDLPEMLNNAKNAFSSLRATPTATVAPTPYPTPDPTVAPTAPPTPEPVLEELSTPTDVTGTEDPAPAGMSGQIPNVTGNFSIQQGRQIPILSYYSVNQGHGTDYPSESVTVDDFSAQMRYLSEQGFTAITFEDLASLETIDKPVMVTFDGGYADVYTSAMPVLRQYNLKATLFVWQDNIGKAGYISESQLQEIASSGLFSIQCSLDNYEELAINRRDEFTSMVAKSKAYVSSLTGREPLAFAYPVGGVNSMEMEVCASEFRFGVRRSGERPYDTSTDEDNMIYRYTMQRDTTLQLFQYWVGKAR